MNLPTRLFDKSKLLFVILCLTFVAYLPVLGNGFTIDDHVFIEQWEEIRAPNLVNFFKGAVPEGHEGVYRPMRSVLYALVFSFAGENPLPYHIVSLIIHLGSTWLVFEITFKLAAKLIEEKHGHLVLAGITGLLFGLHPIHTETIAYTASSFDTLGALLTLATFLLWMNWLKTKNRQDFIKVAAVFALACFSHETSLVLPLTMLVYTWLSSNSLNLRRFTPTLPFFGISIVAVFVRLSVVGIQARGEFLAGSVYLTVLTMIKVIVKYLELFIFPLRLAHQHILPRNIEAFIYRGYNRVPILSQSMLQPPIIFGLILIISLLILAFILRRKLPLVTLGIAWFFIFLIPVSQIIPQGAVLNERSMYLPSLGLIWILALFLSFVLSRSKKIFVLLLVLLSLFYGVRTYMRVRDWQSDMSVWKSDLLLYPTSAYAHYSLGNVLMEKQEYEEAQQQFELAVASNPNFAVAQASVGNALFKQGETGQAALAFERAAAIDPQFYEVYINLGNSYQSLNLLDKARSSYQKALEINPGFTPARTALNKLELIYPQTPTQIYDSKFYSFSYPKDWTVKTNKTKVIVNSQKGFTIELEIIPRTPLDTLEELSKAHKTALGVKLNEGKAALPGTKEALVRIWEKKKTKIFEFMAITDDFTIHAVASPGDSPLMREFDRLFSSIKAK